MATKLILITVASLAIGIPAAVALTRVPERPRPAVNPVANVQSIAQSGDVSAMQSLPVVEQAGQPPSRRIFINGYDTGVDTSAFKWTQHSTNPDVWVVLNPTYSTMETYAYLTVNHQLFSRFDSTK